MIWRCDAVEDEKKCLACCEKECRDHCFQKCCCDRDRDRDICDEDGGSIFGLLIFLLVVYCLFCSNNRRGGLFGGLF